MLNYKTWKITKRRILQNVKSYKTSNLTKRRNAKRWILENVKIQNIEKQNVENTIKAWFRYKVREICLHCHLYSTAVYAVYEKFPKAFLLVNSVIEEVVAEMKGYSVG